jgi:hypothetical protein
MEKTLRMLESLRARGNDGRTYGVRVYEHLVRVDLTRDEHWEPTGELEYKLDDGRPLEVERDGSMRVSGAEGLVLQPG